MLPAAVLASLDDVFVRAAAWRRLPGVCYGVELDEELVHEGAVGHADLEADRAPTSSTLFRIASRESNPGQERVTFRKPPKPIARTRTGSTDDAQAVRTHQNAGSRVSSTAVLPEATRAISALSVTSTVAEIGLRS